MKLQYLAVLALLAAASPTQALVITPLAVGADATAKTTSGTNTDNQLFPNGSASATASSTHTVTYSDGNGGTITSTDTVTSAAYQRDDGFSYIELDVIGGAPQVAATGGDGDFGGEGSTFLALHYYNDGGVAIAPIFNFTLSSIAAVTATWGSDPVEAEFSFSAEVSQPGGGGDSYSASATARSSYNQAEIVNANNMSGTVQPYECFFGDCFRAAYIFDDISDSLNLGILNPGEWIDVIVQMSVSTSYTSYEEGVYARMRDPNGGSAFSYFTTFADTPTAPTSVPAPATWLLLLVGLMVMGKRAYPVRT